MPRPSLIENRQGLEKYLDASVDAHNGKSYIDFVNLYLDKKLPPSQIAHAFFVDTRTVKSWIEFYNKEQL